MTYDKIKSGLEIHQQLDTNKLFCNCPSLIKKEPADFKVERELRAIAGEAGKIDIAAKYEQEKKKKYIYEGYEDCTCLVELDEEPPHIINLEALKYALIIAEFFNMDIFPVLQVMRKVVVDGSNTSGFQRTLLVGVNGYLKLTNKEIKINSLCLEEDSARKIEEGENYIVYRLDRLGIPLLEITTAPDLTNKKEVKEAAEKIGTILRLSGFVKRGLGTIRQDINISIPEGNRVEIKGAQDLDLIEKIVEEEVKRQKNLINWRKKLNEEGIYELKLEYVIVTDLLKNCESKIIKSSINRGGDVLLLKLPNLKGYIGYSLQENRRIGSELADIAKKYGLGGIFHSDELPKYGISKEDVDALYKNSNLDPEKDAFILITGLKDKIILVAKKIIERINDFLKKGVTKDTRQVLETGVTSFMRPMPGSARMYPETDHPLIYVSKKIREEKYYYKIIYTIQISDIIKEFSVIRLKEDVLQDEQIFRQVVLNLDLNNEGFILNFLDPDFRIKYLVNIIGINEKMARDILLHKNLKLFEKYCLKYSNLKPSFIYWLIFNAVKECKNKYEDLDYELIEEDIDKILDVYNKGIITKDAIFRIIYLRYKTGEDIYKIIENYDLKKISGEKLKEKLEKILENIKEDNPKKIMRIVLENLREKADPKDIIELLKKKLNI